MRNRRFIVIVAALAILIVLLLWSTVVRVPSDGALWLWSASDGTLTVPAGGLRLLPRFSGERLEPRELVGTIRSTSSDGAEVSVTVSLRAPVGVWRLQPGPLPEDGLRLLVSDLVARRIGEIPLACLTPGAGQPADCPADPAGELRVWLAATLRAPEEVVSIRLEPDPESVRANLLSAVADRLTIPRHKVLVLGLDGLDWHSALPLVEAGQMPNLRRLMETGTWGEMDTIVPMLSPLIWTTMATGVGPDVHGVLDFVEKDPATGQPVPVTGRSRKVPAIWNLASALGLEVGVVGWWATWPAERVNGTMVSDRLYYTLQQGIPEETFHEDPQDLVFPGERTAEFTTLRDRAVQETDWRALRYFMDIPEARYERAVAENLGMEDPVDGLRRIVSATRTYLGAGLALAGDKPDLMLVYLEGTDTIGHLLAQYLPPPTLDIDPASAALYAAAVPRYFEIVDRWIGRYLQAFSLAEYTVIVVSDHGFHWHEDRPRGLSGTAGPTAPLWHAPDAVFVIAGPGVEARGRVETRPSVYDVAPTLASILGIPSDPSWRTSLLPGAPAAAVAPVEWTPLVPPSSYRQSGGGEVLVDSEYIAKLEALGYIGEDGTSAGAAAAAPTTAEAPSVPATPTPQPATTTRAQLNNLALIKINQKEYDEAERLLHQAIEMSSSYAAPHFNLRRIFMETEQWQRADEQLWIAIDKGLRDPIRTIDRAAADYESLELPERADAMLVRALERYPDHEPYYVHLMVVRLRSDRCPEAIPVGARAVELFPESGPVHSFYGLAAACAGQAALARREMTRALEINPDQPMLQQALEQLPR